VEGGSGGTQRQMAGAELGFEGYQGRGRPPPSIEEVGAAV
jgi:hypothetical protein